MQTTKIKEEHNTNHRKRIVDQKIHLIKQKAVHLKNPQLQKKVVVFLVKNLQVQKALVHFLVAKR